MKRLNAKDQYRYGFRGGFVMIPAGWPLPLVDAIAHAIPDHMPDDDCRRLIEPEVRHWLDDGYLSMTQKEFDRRKPELRERVTKLARN